MIEIFKTNITDNKDASRIRQLLLKQFPGCRVNFDLDDCDKILRIEGDNICEKEVTRLLILSDLECERL